MLKEDSMHIPQLLLRFNWCLAAGGSLSDYLVRNKMDEDVARYFFKQLLAAIRYW
jgi:hypothetical protein